MMDEDQMARIIYAALADESVYISPFDIKGAAETEWDLASSITVDGLIDLRDVARKVLLGIARSTALDKLGKLDGELLEKGGE